MKSQTALFFTLLLAGASAQAASDVVGSWYGPQSSWQFRADGSYVYAAKISQSGGCTIRVSEASSGSWSGGDGALTVKREEGTIENYNSCNSPDTKHKDAAPETVTYGVRFEGDTMYLDDPRYGEESYRRR